MAQTKYSIKHKMVARKNGIGRPFFFYVKDAARARREAASIAENYGGELISVQEVESERYTVARV